jgi:hypothetical protein
MTTERARAEQEIWGWRAQPERGGIKTDLPAQASQNQTTSVRRRRARPISARPMVSAVDASPPLELFLPTVQVQPPASSLVAAPPAELTPALPLVCPALAGAPPLPSGQPA